MLLSSCFGHQWNASVHFNDGPFVFLGLAAFLSTINYFERCITWSEKRNWVVLNLKNFCIYKNNNNLNVAPFRFWATMKASGFLHFHFLGEIDFGFSNWPSFGIFLPLVLLGEEMVSQATIMCLCWFLD